jgi:hypothetical protein
MPPLGFCAGYPSHQHLRDKCHPRPYTPPHPPPPSDDYGPRTSRPSTRPSTTHAPYYRAVPTDAPGYTSDLRWMRHQQEATAAVQMFTFEVPTDPALLRMALKTRSSSRWELVVLNRHIFVRWTVFTRKIACFFLARNDDFAVPF